MYVPPEARMPMIGEELLRQSRLDAGWHQSRSDANDHLTIKNVNGVVTGHVYPDGSIKDFNGSLEWLRNK
jgi:hypothetical protein